MAVLGSTSLTGCNAIPDFIASGSLMLFQQTAAPTGWTKETTHNDKALRVVTGTATPGGTSSFSTMFTSRIPDGTVGDTTLSTPQIPSHSHTGGAIGRQAGGEGVASQPADTGFTGGGGAHSHPFVGTALDFAVQYVDLIICSKNA